MEEINIITLPLFPPLFPFIKYYLLPFFMHHTCCGTDCSVGSGNDRVGEVHGRLVCAY
jgi:hypothetical protein